MITVNQRLVRQAARATAPWHVHRCDRCRQVSLSPSCARCIRTYECIDDGGSSETLHASSMEEALEMAEEWCQDGDWGQDGASIPVTVIEYDVHGRETDREYLTVEIEPDHECLIREATRSDPDRSCGDRPNDHDWTSEGEGGCDQNPGVWSTGGTGLLIGEHCRRCGLHRDRSIVGSQRNPGDHDTTTYTYPEEWCGRCESEECGCERCEECGRRGEECECEQEDDD